MRRDRQLIIGACFVAGCFAVDSASALQARIPVTGVAVRESGEGSTVSLSLGSTEALEEQLILWARLTLAGAAARPSEDLDISVSCAFGGSPDLDESTVVRLPAGADERSLDFDITEIVRALSEGRAAGGTLILHPADRNRAGFTTDELEALTGLRGGEIRVGYRKLTAYGVRGGPQTLAERKASREMRGAADKRPAASGER